jgi:hypothetical protein
MKIPHYFFQGEEDRQSGWAQRQQVLVNQVGDSRGSRQPSLQVLLTLFHLQGWFTRGLNQVSDDFP